MGWSRRWHIGSREKLLRVLGALREFDLNFREHPVEIVVREPLVQHSAGQRALFHAVCDDVGPRLGYTPGEFKDELKKIYFGDGWDRLSTEDLDHEHYGYLIETAYRVAAWCEIVVLDRRSR